MKTYPCLKIIDPRLENHTDENGCGYRTPLGHIYHVDVDEIETEPLQKIREPLRLKIVDIDNLEINFREYDMVSFTFDIGKGRKVFLSVYIDVRFKDNPDMMRKFFDYYKPFLFSYGQRMVINEKL